MGSRPLVLLESLQNKQSSCSFSRDSQLPASTQNSANKINILPTKEPTPLCQLSNVSTRNVYHHVRHYPTLNLYGLVKTTIIYSELLFWWFKTRRFLLRHVFNVRLGAMTKQWQSQIFNSTQTSESCHKFRDLPTYLTPSVVWNRCGPSSVNSHPFSSTTFSWRQTFPSIVSRQGRRAS